jgi:CRP-like cAMP-binding protein
MPAHLAVSTEQPLNLPALENLLMQRLPGVDRARLLALCDQVPLGLGEVLCEQGARAEFAYFPTEGFISQVVDVAGKPPLEVGLVGFEGMLGIGLALNVVHSPLQAVVRRAGMAWRISAEALASELSSDSALQRVLSRYACVLINQLGTHAGCLRFHLIEHRLARWLLMAQDRARADQFHVTHEFLAAVLGVRRVSITTAAGALQRDGLIKYQHGEVTVVDRSALEARVCTCYASDQAAYAQGLSCEPSEKL